MNHNYGFLKACEEWEVSVLCGILLFESGNRDEKTQRSLLMRTLSSLVAEGNGEYTLNGIREKLDRGFNVKWDDDWEYAYEKLMSDGILKRNRETETLSVNIDSEKSNAFFDELNAKTTRLIDGIYDKYIVLGPNQKDPIVIKNYIREALSVYYKVSGLSFFNIQRKEWKSLSVLGVLDKLEDKSKKCLAQAIGSTISNPTLEEKEVLEVWAKAFVLGQMTHLDPTLSEYRQQQLRNKSFVLDTDFVLYALTTHARYSSEYHKILDYLRNLNCEICIPSVVRKEVLGCINDALHNIEKYGEERLVQLGSTYTDNSKRNVFIEDFICIKRDDPTMKNMPFACYIGNLYREGSSVIFNKKLCRLIGEENFEHDLELEEIEGELHETLKQKILDKTIESPKGQDRTDWFNDRAATYDTQIYLTLKKKNQDIEEKGALPYKYYLLTRSTKTIYCARELGIYDKNIICNPQAMITVLNELGDVKEDMGVINLFENPFLAYVAEATWNLAEPLLKRGYTLQYEDIDVLRLECEEDFHDLLNGKTHEELAAAAIKYEGKGYKFTQDISTMEYENQKLREGKRKDQETIDELNKKVGRYEHILAKKKYEDRVRSDSKKNKVLSKLKKYL